MSNPDSLPDFSALLDGVDDGITVQDRSGRIVYANLEGARLIGFDTVQAFLAANLAKVLADFDILDESGQPVQLSQLPGRRVFETGQVSELVMRYRHKATGRERWTRVRAKPIKNARGEIAFAMNLFHDILETRQKEEALRMSQEWFSMALKSVGDAVIATDPKGIVTFMNPAAEALTGYTSQEAVGAPLQQVFRIVDEDTRRPALNPVERVIAAGTVVGLAGPTILITRQGGEVAIGDSAAPILDESGRLAGTILVFRDVSEPRAAELRRDFIARALDELNSSLDYRNTLTTVARLAVPKVADWCGIDILEGDDLKRVAVAHIDPQKIKFVEDLAKRYPADRNATSGVWNVLRTGKSEIFPDIPHEMLTRAALDAEHLALIEQLQLCSFLAVPLNVRGQTIGVISLAMAESRRRHNQADLELAMALADRAAVVVDNARLFQTVIDARLEASAHSEMLRSLVMTAPAAISIQAGPELRFELVNEPYQMMFPGRDLVGKTPKELSPDADLSLLQEVWNSGQPARLTRFPFTFDWSGTGNPHTRYFDFTVQPLKDSEGRFERLVTFSLDVTEQVLSQQKLEAARVEAELANRSKDEFLAMLGHELRNPLAPILTALQIMKMRSAETAQKERLVIERQVRHVVRLVDDLLDVSRITRGKLDLHREPLDIADVVAKAIEMASPLIEHKQHELTTSVGPQLIVDGDSVRLAQVVANLLTNAAKYTPPRGRIHMLVEAMDDKVLIRVKDNGIGIDHELLPNVFDLFAQGRQEIDRSAGGLGLGLAIVKSLTAMHGGNAEVLSEGPGQGSEFRISLPRLSPAEGLALAAARTSPHSRPTVGARILIVDDNADARELLQEALELSGHQVFAAEDGPSALLVAEEKRPDIALLDIGLPVMDGYELARQLRALPDLANLKLIALTGYGQSADKQRAASAGFNLHLVKPISLDLVEEKIRELTAEPT